MRRKLTEIDNICFNPVFADTKTIWSEVKKLNNINAQDKDGRTPLWLSCCYGNVEIAKKLILAGVDTNIQDDLKYSALHAAVSSRKFDCVKLLLENGADPNLQDKWGNIPLSRACYLDLNIIRILVDFGSDFRKNNFYGNSPYTTFSAYPEVMKIFNEQGK